MPVQNLTEELKKRSAWSIFMGVLTAALGVFLIFYPLATATITAVLLGWVLIFVGIALFVFALHSQTVGNFFLKILLGRSMESAVSRWRSFRSPGSQP